MDNVVLELIREYLDAVLLDCEARGFVNLRILTRNEIHFDDQSIGHYRAVVYLECDGGLAMYELYRPTVDVEVNARACEEDLRQYLNTLRTA